MSQFAQHSDPVKRSLGALLRARRQERGLTLQELSERASLSAAFISQAERGKATPSIVSLINLAKALDTDIHYSLTPPAPGQLVRRGDHPEYIDIDSPVTFCRLDAEIRNQQMSALKLELPAGTELPTVSRETGEDFFYVLEGEVEQMLGDEVFTLRAGDSAHHNTQVNHNVRNVSGASAVLIWVGTLVLFPPGVIWTDGLTHP